MSSTDVNSEPRAATAPRADLLARFLKPHPLVLAAVWLFFVVHSAGSWTTIGNVFSDTDDAMRLVEVRDFLAGQGWFDLHQYRLDPPAGLPMHWSRLVDLPIALVIRLAELVVPAATAEKVAMFLWPTLLLIPVLFAVRRIACRIGGDLAALPALYLTVTCLPAIGQFVPGRIDHHNLQIALTLWLLAFLFDPPSWRRGVKLAVVSAAMMAVGMETLPFVVLAACAVAWRFVVGATREEPVAYGLALAAATAAFVVGTLPPNLWTWGACDALSANYAALAIVGGLGLALGAWAEPGARALRIAHLAAVGGLALFAFAVPEPACLRGPFGQILPQVRAVWLDGVTEVLPWHVFFASHRIAASVALAVPLIGFAAAAYLARDPAGRRRISFLALVAALTMTTAIGLGQIRTMVYACILAVPLIAAAIGRFAVERERRGTKVTVSVLAGTLLTSTSLLTAVITAIAPASWTATQTAVATPAGGAPETSVSGAAAGAPCMTLSNYATLAALPPGLVAAEINIGPSILAATPHSVVTAPYHRMQRGILDGDRMLRAAPAEALAVMDRRRVDYVALCTASQSVTSFAQEAPDSLFVALTDGRIPDRLELVADGVVRVYRLKPANALAELRGSLTFR